MGLHAALFLKKSYPLAKILILEKSLIGAAASSKNAGFACFGSVSEIVADVKNLGSEVAFELIKMRWEGLKLLIETNGKESLGLEKNGGFELFTNSDKLVLEECGEFIPELNERLEYIGKDVYGRIPGAPYNFNGVNEMIYNRFEAQVETDMMYFNLVQKVLQTGVQLLRGLEVKSFEDLGDRVEIQVSPGGFSFNVRKLLITNNGFAATLIPDANVEPARAQVLVTAPIPGLNLKGTFHYDQGYYYFRNCENRLLIGGGRNSNFTAEKTFDQEVTEEIQQKIEELLFRVILKSPVDIDYRWAGTMGLGTSKFPIIQEVSSNVYCGVRMGGMGVAIGALVAKRLAAML